jgi:hypothetical protein
MGGELELSFFGNSHAILLNTVGVGGLYFNDASSTLTRKWFLHVNVTDYLGNPVPNANVRIEDNKAGSYNETFVTDGNGHLRWIPVTQYIQRNSGKTYSTPQRITAWNDTLVGYVYPDPVIDHSQYVDIVLGNGTFINLEKGWNLMSIPRIQPDNSTEVVLRSIEGRYDKIWCYNRTVDTDLWGHYHSSKPSSLNNLDDLNHTMGFWLYITDPEGTTMALIGESPTSNQTIPLYPGWNLVGYPSLSAKNRTTALNNLSFGIHLDAVWAYNTTTQRWFELDEPTDLFEPGSGYWIHAKKKCVWDVPL